MNNEARRFSSSQHIPSNDFLAEAMLRSGIDDGNSFVNQFLVDTPSNPPLVNSEDNNSYLQFIQVPEQLQLPSTTPPVAASQVFSGGQLDTGQLSGYDTNQLGPGSQHNVETTELSSPYHVKFSQECVPYNTAQNSTTSVLDNNFLPGSSAVNIIGESITGRSSRSILNPNYSNRLIPINRGVHHYPKQSMLINDSSVLLSQQHQRLPLPAEQLKFQQIIQSQNCMWEVPSSMSQPEITVANTAVSQAHTSRSSQGITEAIPHQVHQTNRPRLVIGATRTLSHKPISRVLSVPSRRPTEYSEGQSLENQVNCAGPPRSQVSFHTVTKGLYRLCCSFCNYKSLIRKAYILLIIFW